MPYKIYAKCPACEKEAKNLYEIEEQFENILNAHISVMTPEQAVKKGYMHLVSETLLD